MDASGPTTLIGHFAPSVRISCCKFNTRILIISATSLDLLIIRRYRYRFSSSSSSSSISPSCSRKRGYTVARRHSPYTAIRLTKT